jgi:pimeloyl-ACP methyl ester carboxylesterase
MRIEDYTIAVPEHELADLGERLLQTRWPEALSDDWSRGTPVPYAKRLADRWRTGFDWRAAEARLNELPQLLAEIDGQRIHGFHVTSSRADAVPLLMCHGYPSSFVEFAGIARALAEPEDDSPAFHVVAPSIPGYGFSTPLAGHGWDIAATAQAFDAIMVALGHERYLVFGEDVGAGISEQLCLDAGDHVIASLVATDPGAIATQYTPPTDHLSDAERERHDGLKAARAEDFGYLALQTTRPLSVAYGLMDSPVAQLTWIVEKFQEWTDSSRELPEDAVDIDALLTLVSVAWFGRSGYGAANLLYETAHAAVAWGREHDRPQGMVTFGEEQLMRRILDGDGRLAYWNEHSNGGHFPALEAPEDLVADIRAFAAVPAVSQR